MPDIAHVMTEDPVTVEDTESLDACETIMHDRGIRHLPVVDADGAVVGLVTDAIARRNRGSGENARAVATRNLLVVSPDTELEDILTRFVRTGFDAAVIVDDDRAPTGIFTEHDAVGLAASSLSPNPKITGIEARAVHTVPLTAKAADALETMITHQFRHVVVTDEGRAVGVLSYRDLVARQIGPSSDDAVSDIVGDRLLYVNTGVAVLDVCRLMHEHKIGSMPVLDDDGAPVQILTRTDVIGALLDELSEHGF